MSTDAHSGGPKEPNVRWRYRSPCEGVTFEGKGHDPTCQTTLWHELCNNSWTNRDAVCVMDTGGPKAAGIRWGLDTRVKGQLLGGRTCPILCELCKNGWTYQFSVSVVDSGGPKEARFNHMRRWRQRDLMGENIGATCRIRLNHLSAAAIRPYVQLLWPHVTVTVFLYIIWIQWCW